MLDDDQKQIALLGGLLLILVAVAYGMFTLL